MFFEYIVRFFSSSFQAVSFFLLSALWVTLSHAAPVSLFAFSEGEGHVTADEQSGYVGTLSNTRWVEGVRGTGLGFGGKAYVTLADDRAFDVTDALTIQAWMRLTSANSSGYIITKNYGWKKEMPFLLGMRRGQVRVVLANRNYDTGYVPVVGVWTHLSLTWDGEVARLYSDGREVWRVNHGGVLATNNQRLIIGARNNNGSAGQAFYFQGALDEVSLWSEAKDPSAVCVDAGRVWMKNACVVGVSNTAPVAQDTGFRVNQDEFYTGRLLAADGEGDALTYSVESNASNGRVTVTNTATGAFEYVPRTGYVGSDRFTFSVHDGVARSNTATVNVTVAPLPTADLEMMSFSFSEGTGVITTDDVNGYVGTLSNTRWVEGVRGTGLGFGGKAYVTLADDRAFDVTDALTIQAWMRLTSANSSGYIITKNYGWKKEMPFLLGMRRGQVRVVLANRNYDTGYVPVVGVWTHLSLTWDGEVARLYSDGREVWRVNHGGVLATNNQRLIIGARNNNGSAGQAFYFQGALDEVSLWSEAKDPSAVCVDAGRVWTENACVAGADTIAPTVRIVLPDTSLGVPEQGLRFEAFANDHSGVANVLFQLNGLDVGQAISSPPFVVTLGRASLPGAKTYKLRAIARDVSGNSEFTEVEFTIPDVIPPVVRFITPLEGSVLSPQLLNVQVSAEDDVGVASVEFLLNGVAFGTVAVQPPYSAVLDTNGLINPGSHTLTARATDVSGNIFSETIEVRIEEEATPSIDGLAKIFLTQARLDKMLAHKAREDEIWQYFESRLDYYLTVTPYSGGEYAAAYALAYRLTGRSEYLNRAKELFWSVYQDWNYKSRNGFRGNNRFAHYVFDWLRDGLSQTERGMFISLFKRWADYWEEHIDYANNFSGFRWADTDETTSLAENFLLLALSLEGEDDVHAQRLFDISDVMLSRFVVNEFMQKLMIGGVWGEGSDYSPNTMRHWLRAFIINKETRGQPMPTNYAQDVLHALIHMTFPDRSSMFQYGDVEAASDYRSLAGDYRFQLILVLIEALENEDAKALGQYWLNILKQKEGVPSLNSSAGMWRLMFEYSDAPALSPDDISMSTTYIAEGLQFVAARTGWGETENVVYFQNAAPKVDHMQQDALSFNIISEGVVITKESTGYAGVGDASIAHNTLLIDNRDGGSSSPTGRFAGEGVLKTVASTDRYSYIEADATQLYNSSGWRADVYVDSVVRKLVFLKPDVVVVYDSIDMLEGFEGRWRKYIQHFQVEPALDGNGYYSAVSEGKKFYFKTLLPVDALTTKVDESLLWSDAQEYQLPLNQRKWHLSVEPGTPNLSQTEFLHILQFGDDAELRRPKNVTTLSVAKGNVLSGALLGLHVEGEVDTVVLFRKNGPDSLEYKIKGTAKSQHVIFGLSPGTRYKIEPLAQGEETTVTVTPGLGYQVGANGVLEFDL